MTIRFRQITRIITGTPAVDGAGVSLTRVIGPGDVRELDPFLMLDAFDSVDPKEYLAGFPWHPHRGIETITYLIEGDVEHRDSLGHQGSIKSGDAQWMTAGSGIIHQEMPVATKRLWGAQLWVNLPRKDKLCAPHYGDILHETIPMVSEQGVDVRVISGLYKDQKGAFQGTYVPVTLWDVTLDRSQVWSVSPDPTHTVFLYLFSGGLHIDGKLIKDRRAVLFGEGDRVQVRAGGDGEARFLFLSAPPLHEPVAWGGPIVMNTQLELQEAFEELQNGNFLKH